MRRKAVFCSKYRRKGAEGFDLVLLNEGDGTADLAPVEVDVPQAGSGRAAATTLRALASVTKPRRHMVGARALDLRLALTGALQGSLPCRRPGRLPADREPIHVRR